MKEGETVNNIKICLICKNLFKVIPYRAKVAKYCSLVCSVKSRTGKGNYFYGKKHSEKTKEKLREAKRLNPPKGWRSEDFTPEMKKKISESVKKLWDNPEYRKNASEKHKGQFMGEKHPNWKGGVDRFPSCLDCGKKLSRPDAVRCRPCHSLYTKGRERSMEIRIKQKNSMLATLEKKGKRSRRKETYILRHSLEYRAWRQAVFERDDYICQECNRRGGDLQADHIKPWASYPELRFNIGNGRTLCIPCHQKTDTFPINLRTYV